VDLTQNAIVTDASGRAAGVQNGLPIRYIPGSTVENVDGKLVVTIPNAQSGLLRTFVRPDAPALGGRSPSSVTVQTQVIVKNVGIVADDRTPRAVQNGAATGAVVLTDDGLLLVPDGDAPTIPAPHIGKLPPRSDRVPAGHRCRHLPTAGGCRVRERLDRPDGARPHERRLRSVDDQPSAGVAHAGAHPDGQPDANAVTVAQDDRTDHRERDAGTEPDADAAPQDARPDHRADRDADPDTRADDFDIEPDSDPGAHASAADLPPARRLLLAAD